MTEHQPQGEDNHVTGDIPVIVWKTQGHTCNGMATFHSIRMGSYVSTHRVTGERVPVRFKWKEEGKWELKIIQSYSFTESGGMLLQESTGLELPWKIFHDNSKKADVTL
uniref:Uncharacterized protein n=1 Tax=Cyclophora tenuis TaxID=216820 RepID=A0A7S1D168_CYCTE|mmetsp:Transcript_18293/g.31168  ORF Transcript_18293/g.31168 Transcript_18293/m.31168 type:complete len:109 (+) Transcript_18293:112-438(+)